MFPFVFAKLILLIHLMLSSSINVEKNECFGTDKGWKCDFESTWSHRNGQHIFCDLDIISLNETSLEEFKNKYYMKKPVLINSKISDFTLPAMWNKKLLIQFLGEFVMDSGESLKIIQFGGSGRNRISLKQFLKNIDLKKNEYNDSNEQQYIFDRSIWKQQQLNKRSKVSMFLQEISHSNIKYFKYSSKTLKYDDKILAIGNTGTGATFHQHGTAWFYNVYGRKRWFLYPPNLSAPGGFPPSYSSLDWFNIIYPHLNITYHQNLKYELLYNQNNYDNLTILMQSLLHKIENFQNKNDILHSINNDKYSSFILFKPLECIQTDGQILYIPEFYWHSIINIGESVGFSIQSTQKTSLWQLSDPNYDIKNVTNNIIYGDEAKWSDLEIETQKLETYKNRQLLYKYSPLSAITQFDKALSLLKISSINYINKVKIYCIKALLMDPTFIFVYVQLAEIYLTEDNVKLSEKLLRIAYMLNPNDYYTRKALIDLFTQYGKKHLIPHINKRQPLPYK